MSCRILAAVGILCLIYPETRTELFRILSELGLSKNGYYKHYHQLEDNGIMLIERSQCKNNKYHLFFRKLIEKYKFGFAYKEIMTDPNISLVAKTVFVYITSYCPKGKIWYFKKSEITEELGVSAYVLNRALKELSALDTQGDT